MKSTMPDFPLTITSIMRYGTERHADREISTFDGEGFRRRPYGEIGQRAARLAGGLRALGVDGDQRVATFMWNNTEHLEAYLAVPCMGAVLHTLNIRLAPDQLAYIANHAEDEVVIADATLVPLLARVLPEMKTVRHVVVARGGDLSGLQGAGREVHDYEELLAGSPTEFAWPVLDERGAAAMCYTSGTTGHPKGVVYSHRSAYLHSTSVVSGNAMGMSAHDRVLPVVPMFHANAWGLPYAALLAGAGLVMPDRFLQAEPLVRVIEGERPTLSGAVPTIWNDVLRYAREHRSDLSSLRLVTCGGSAVPEALMRAFHDEFGVSIIHAWGMTETSPLGSIAHPPPGASGEEAWAYRRTQGRLLAGLEGRIVGEAGVLPSDGRSVGELEVRGPWVTSAYYLDHDPGKFHDGWLRTGDVGTLDRQGYVTLTDRAKDVIKSGGEWISTVELENSLMAHPAVTEAVVVGVPDERWGERPLACVLLEPDATATPDELREFLSASVAKWQLPERWAMVSQIPKTSVGKFAKARVRELYATGSLDVIHLHRSQT